MLFVLILSALAVVEGNPIYNGVDVGSVVVQDTRIVIRNKGKHPYVVHLKITEVFKKKSDTYRTNTICSGVLIARSVVLTAAHCIVELIKDPSVEATVGTVHRTMDHNGQTSEMKDYYLHEGYLENQGDRYLENDIAILWLNKEFILTANVKIAELAESSQYLKYERMLVVGWGRLANGYRPNMLQEGQLQIITQEQCQLVHSPTRITKSVLCALSSKRDVIPCQGDSGGPLVYRGVVYGITSWATATKLGSDVKRISCLPNFPAVFTKISEYKTWINLNMEKGPPAERIKSPGTTNSQSHLCASCVIL